MKNFARAIGMKIFSRRGHLINGIILSHCHYTHRHSYARYYTTFTSFWYLLLVLSRKFTQVETVTS